MQEYLDQGSLDLARSSVLRVEDGRDILIYVRPPAYGTSEV